MKTRNRPRKNTWLLAMALVWPFCAVAQVPVDENGNPVGQAENPGVVAEEDLAILSAAELEDLIGPIALYPDDLLAIVLPASTYPLQIVEAARFLEALEEDPSLKPDEDWDDSVVALTNYPEVVEMMSDDLDWTWRLGEAVVAQQTDVIKAIESFRDRAYAAGNLKSDDFQSVTEEDGVISITPVEEEVIYVPYYEPERVVVYQPRPVYYYYPRPYPVYYYPYPADYSFGLGYFWGVTTAFTIGWHTHHLATWHYSYYGHPYYGHTYWYNNWWYRRPNINVYNTYYVHNNYNSGYDRYRRGDYWQPNTRRTVRSSDQRITRTRYYAGANRQSNASTSVTRTTTNTLARSRNDGRTAATTGTAENRQPITFRERTGTATRSQTTLQPRTTTNARTSSASTSRTRTVDASANRSTTTTLSAAGQRNTANSSVARPSTSRSLVERTQQATRLGSSSVRRQSATTSSTPRTSYVQPSVSRITSSRLSTSGSSYSRPSTTQRQSVSRPSTSGSSYSRPSTTQRQSVSGPSTTKASQSRTNSSSNRSSNNRVQSSARNSSDRR